MKNLNCSYKLPFTPLSFDPKAHKYFNDNGQEYMSVTTFIKQGEEFDAEGIAARVITNERSKYYGMTKEAVLKQWKESAPLGTKVHAVVEDFINEGTYPTDKTLTPLVVQFSNLKFNGKLLSEVVVHDPEFLIAGTADILEVCDDEIWLWDIKTSVSRPKGDRVSDDKIGKFSLQLEMYRRLVERCFKLPCRIGGIIWFKDYSKQREKTKLKVFKVHPVGGKVNDLLQARRIEMLKELK